MDIGHPKSPWSREEPPAPAPSFPTPTAAAFPAALPNIWLPVNTTRRAKQDLIAALSLAVSIHPSIHRQRARAGGKAWKEEQGLQPNPAFVPPPKRALLAQSFGCPRGKAKNACDVLQSLLQRAQLQPSEQLSPLPLHIFKY